MVWRQIFRPHAIAPRPTWRTMSQFIAGISVFCIAASYGVTFVLEVSRLFFRAPVRIAVMFAFAAAGLIAHTLFLGREAITGDGPPLSSWQEWCLMVGWLVVVAYLILALRKPDTAFGVFLLPVVLALTGAAYLLGDGQRFEPAEATQFWRIVHGLALLSGTAVVTLGCAAGTMFLLQSYRLKHKMPPGGRFKLPSLETLQLASERSLVVSTLLLMAGLLSGIVLNAIEHLDDNKGVAWTDPVVWTSAVLLLWLLGASVFNYLYKPARRGRKVAYLVVASFLFLGLELALVLLVQHASTPVSEGPQTAVEKPAPSQMQPRIVRSGGQL